MIIINQYPTFLVDGEDIELSWAKAVRALAVEKRIERIKLGFADPDIKELDDYRST